MKQVRKMVGRGMTHLNHSDRHTLRIISDEADVQFSVELLKKRMTGRPFDPNESYVVGILTGTLAPPDVARHILDGHKNFIEAYEEFK